MIIIHLISMIIIILIIDTMILIIMIINIINKIIIIKTTAIIVVTFINTVIIIKMIVTVLLVVSCLVPSCNDDVGRMTIFRYICGWPDCTGAWVVALSVMEKQEINFLEYFLHFLLFVCCMIFVGCLDFFALMLKVMIWTPDLDCTGAWRVGLSVAVKTRDKLGKLLKTSVGQTVKRRCQRNV